MNTTIRLHNVTNQNQSFNGVSVAGGQLGDVTMPQNQSDPSWANLKRLVPATFTVEKPTDAECVKLLESMGIIV